MAGITVVSLGGITASLLGFLGGGSSTLIVISALVLLLIWFVARMRVAQRRIAAAAGPGELDGHLRWGMFYANHDDERVLVEHGMGTTLNFARPEAWLLLAALLSPAVVLIAVAIPLE